MYKMFILLRNKDEDLLNTFSSKTFEIIKELKSDSLFGEIEGSVLTEDKFSRIIEIFTNDINEMNILLASAEGKNLTRHLSNYMGHITTFFAEFKD